MGQYYRDQGYEGERGREVERVSERERERGRENAALCTCDEVRDERRDCHGHALCDHERDPEEGDVYEESGHTKREGESTTCVPVIERHSKTGIERKRARDVWSSMMDSNRER